MNEWEWQLLEDKIPLDCVSIGEGDLRPGDSVRLRPRPGGDVFDLALSGKIATIESIEQDYEGKAHLAVVVDDDPGRDFGLLRQPGHRFFFSPEEVEPCARIKGESSRTKGESSRTKGESSRTKGESSRTKGESSRTKGES